MSKIVYDISHHQTDAYFNRINKVMAPIILKSGNGTSGVDPTFHARKEKCLNLMACYSYGYGSTNMKKMGVKARELFSGITYLDIEKEYFEKNPTKAQLLQDCIDFFGTADRSKWYIYGGYEKYKTWFKSNRDFDGAHFWIARYQKNNPYIDDVEAFLASHNPPSMSKYHTIDGWQFTSAGGDRSVWYVDINHTSVIGYPVPTRTLKLTVPRMKGNDVKWMQHILGIEEDGSFGPATSEALKNWQTKHGLQRDGKCGPQTRAAMLAMIS